MTPTPLDSERLLWWTCDCWCSPLKRAWLEIFCECLMCFFAGKLVHIPVWGSWEIHRNSKVSNWEWDMWSFSGGYQINLKTSFKINKCLIFSGGLAESLVEALTGAPFIASRGSLLVPRMFILKDQFWWPDSRTKKQRFTFLFFQLRGKHPMHVHSRNLR